MASFAFKQVDVFTDKPFLGNPVAVVIGAEGLETREMQRIACWTNLSETTFLLKSEVADYRLRIFTPRQELPFAGHPTIGSAHAALESGFVKRKDALTQECGAGIIYLSVEKDGIFLRGPQAKVSDVRKTLPFATKLLRVDVGPVWVVGEVADSGKLAALQPDMAALSDFSHDVEATGVTLFAASGEKGCAIHVRSFAPAHGIPERRRLPAADQPDRALRRALRSAPGHAARPRRSCEGAHRGRRHPHRWARGDLCRGRAAHDLNPEG
jgi:PhzF family phenazine biosynthesis protein